MSATNTAKVHNIVYMQDPGHGWGLVPMLAIMAYGIEHQISTFSYFMESTGMAALEEDCDFPLFIRAAEKAGDTVILDEQHTDFEANIRNWPSFPECEEATTAQVTAFNQVNDGLDMYGQLDALFTRYKDCFTGMYHNCLWKLMIDRTIENGAFLKYWDGRLVVALESGGFVPTGVQFVEPSHVHHDVILEELNRYVFKIDHPRVEQIVIRSLSLVQSSPKAARA